MGNGADGDAASASRRRCPKHPSEPPFTGFCSACLLDRLHATNLVLASPQPLPYLAPPGLQSLDLEEEEPSPPCSTAGAGAGAGAGRTTLLHLFQLEDQGANQQEQASTSCGDSQDPAPDLQRKRSLRQSCSDWMACCDTSAAANHSSCFPSRQSLDASSSTTAAAPAHVAAAAPCTTTTGVAVVERRTGSLRWNQVWAIRGFLAKPASRHLLNRSFSESSRSRYAHHPGSAAVASSSSSQSQGIRLNSSHSASSAGNVMEISLPDDSVGHCRPRLKNRLHWLRRSHSVHYSSPTSLVDAGLTPFRSRSRSRSRSSSSRSTADKTQQVRRLNLNLDLFAAGFFGTQRHQH
ncbi:uncharacterized protein LOC133917331 [Phragmites australis]|uniref:uncharacterized protein LOC133917331 n=1 Tax=Phragmites australis TaxID=29695 RepID=UPI002D788FE6|nr:uncharacterized protein LOC133917331 [Phragmites australis]